jgi:hypothetical protein
MCYEREEDRQDDTDSLPSLGLKLRENHPQAQTE